MVVNNLVQVLSLIFFSRKKFDLMCIESMVSGWSRELVVARSLILGRDLLTLGDN
jgi:hypothetical protein